MAKARGGVLTFSFKGVDKTVGMLATATRGIRVGQIEAAKRVGDDGLTALKDKCPVFRGNLKEALKQQIQMGMRDVDIVFYVDDQLRYETRATNPTPPSTYVEWVLYGRGPVEPLEDDGFLVYSAHPENDEWIYSKYSRSVEGFDFVQEAVDGMDGEIDSAAQAWAFEISRA